MMKTALAILALCLIGLPAGASPPTPQLASLRIQNQVAAQANHRSVAQQTEALRHHLDAKRQRRTHDAQAAASATPSRPQRP